jgi:hypothetical protein
MLLSGMTGEYARDRRGWKLWCISAKALKSACFIGYRGWRFGWQNRRSINKRGLSLIYAA